MLTADHPNAKWLHQLYFGAAAIENDSALTAETRKAKKAEHIKLMTSRMSPGWVIHTGGIKLAATVTSDWISEYHDRRKALTNGTFRAIRIDQILADDLYGIIYGTFAAEQNGEAIEMMGVGAWRFENDLVVEHWEMPPGDVWDDLFLAGDPDFQGTAEEFWRKK